MNVPYSEENESKLDLQRLAINVGTVIICLGVLAVPTFYYVEGCSPKYQGPEQSEIYKTNNSDPMNRFIWILFLVLAVVFFSVGLVLLMSLKNYFNEFYEEQKYLLWSAMLILTLPLSFRAILDYSLEKSTKMYNFVINNNTNFVIYQWSFFILTTYTPILA
jgi:hypothetical protein